MLHLWVELRILFLALFLCLVCQHVCLHAHVDPDSSGNSNQRLHVQHWHMGMVSTPLLPLLRAPNYGGLPEGTILAISTSTYPSTPTPPQPHKRLNTRLWSLHQRFPSTAERSVHENPIPREASGDVQSRRHLLHTHRSKVQLPWLSPLQATVFQKI